MREAAAGVVVAPAGELACRAQSTGQGTVELFLEWSGGSAKGVLRTTAPSGMVTTQKVSAERYQGNIIADDVNAKDLVVHAATVASKDGKRYMRLAEWGARWAACD